MTSNRPKHIEPSSTIPTGGDTRKARALWNPSQDQSDSAAVKKSPLSSATPSLMESVVETENMLTAWQKVKANKGAPGPDGITLEEFEHSFRHQWPNVRQQLIDGTYRPSAARRKTIAKDDGSDRHLGIPNIQDRLIQQAILQVLTPMFDPNFSESSFGFRPRRSAQGAVKQVQHHIRSGYRHCVDMDLSKFFDRVQHDVLLSRVARVVQDKRLLCLLGRYLRAGVLVDNHWEPSHEGTMQGGPLSPLLANILLDDFDKELEQRGLRFVRYADDFLVFTKTEKAAHRVFVSVERFLTRKLKLVVNQQKSRVCKADGVEFLGFRFEGYSGQIRVSPKNQTKFKQRVRAITRRARGVSMSSRLRDLGRYLRGWVGYFCVVPIKSYFAELDKWVRRRLRACYWKQWRKPRTRVGKLLSLGLPREDAVPFGSSSRGAWHMARMSCLNQTLTNAYLAERGLVSLLEVWSRLAPRYRNA